MRAAKRILSRTPILVFLCLLPFLALAEEIGQDRLELKSIKYSARLGRDPFAIPDFDAETIARPTIELNLLEAVLVGIVKGPGMHFALVEDEVGESYTLLVGDPVYKGKIEKIGDEFLDAVLYSGGVQRRVRLDLVKEGE